MFSPASPHDLRRAYIHLDQCILPIPDTAASADPIPLHAAKIKSEVSTTALGNRHGTLPFRRPPTSQPSSISRSRHELDSGLQLAIHQDRTPCSQAARREFDDDPSCALSSRSEPGCRGTQHSAGPQGLGEADARETCPAMARFRNLEKPVVKLNDEMVGALLTNYSFFKFYAAVDPETLLDLRVLIVPRNTSLTDTVAKAMDLKRKMRYGSRLQYFLC
ncbi:hypothetical protein F4823DRAFT_630796 [Ustulina deusta]|nr:hypothetical protein F4823DRAFT_630796 [Ustulina deusta]